MKVVGRTFCPIKEILFGMDRLLEEHSKSVGPLEKFLGVHIRKKCKNITVTST